MGLTKMIGGQNTAPVDFKCRKGKKESAMTMRYLRQGSMSSEEFTKMLLKIVGGLFAFLYVAHLLTTDPVARWLKGLICF